MKVLFVYPNVNKPASIQIGLYMLSAMLKKGGHQTDLFDITFLTDGSEEREFLKKVKSFTPDLIAISCRSNEWEYTRGLLKKARELGIKTVVGGPHPTVIPEKVIEDCDYLVQGEGEHAMLELANALEKGKDPSMIKNLWMKKGGEIIRNPVRPLIQDLDSLPMPDVDLFSQKHLSKCLIFSMTWRKQQKIPKGILLVETSRGCPFSCTYCINPFLQNLYKGQRYHREKSIDRVMNEIKFWREKYEFDFIYLVDEILLIKTDRIREFCEKYKKEINLPFYFLTRPETVTKEKIEMMVDAGAKFTGIGIEAGNEEFRRKVLNRQVSQQQLRNAFRICRECGLHTNAYNMIGFPSETRNNIQDTLEINDEIKPDNVQVSIFSPYEGTPLRDMAVMEGFLDKDAKVFTSYYKGTQIRFKNMTAEQINRLNKLMMIFVFHRRFWPLMRFLERNQKAYTLFVVLYYLIRRSGEIPVRVKQQGFRGLIKKTFRDWI